MDFNTLYIKLSPILMKIARTYEYGAPFIDKDDLYQEMSIHLWNNFKDGVPSNINIAYIAQGCKLHILNYLRKNRDKAKIFSLEEPLNENGKTIKDKLATQTEHFARKVDRKMVFEEIRNNGFTRREKDVLSYLLVGLTVREVGKKLGISHVMVIKVKQRLIKKWRKKNKGYQTARIFT